MKLKRWLVISVVIIVFLLITIILITKSQTITKDYQSQENLFNQNFEVEENKSENEIKSQNESGDSLKESQESLKTTEVSKIKLTKVGNKITNFRDIIEGHYIFHPYDDEKNTTQYSLPIIDGKVQKYVMGPCKGCTQEQASQEIDCNNSVCPIVDIDTLIEDGFFAATLVLRDDYVYEVPTTDGYYETGIMALFWEYGLGNRVDHHLYIFGVKSNGEIETVGRRPMADAEHFVSADLQNARYFKTRDQYTGEIFERFLEHGI